ncbi:MAG: Crp/Fnr family transcriptional regulator [Bacteroidetes bacterium]|nr:Crp/Fnr family transcriptional regulator [Bacteroidota bacterium]
MTDFYTGLLNFFEQHAVRKLLSKEELLLKEGQVENNLYFIHSGAIRVFLLSEYEEVNIRFGYNGSVINSLASFLLQQPSSFYTEALRKTEISVLTRSQLQQFIGLSTENLKGYTAFMESAFAQQIEREIDLLTVSPADRLARVLKRSPTLFQEIPLKHIASYLRMTPETLSRIRKSTTLGSDKSSVL